jgi:hypothetical protein
MSILKLWKKWWHEDEPLTDKEEMNLIYQGFVIGIMVNLWIVGFMSLFDPRFQSSTFFAVSMGIWGITVLATIISYMVCDMNSWKE